MKTEAHYFLESIHGVIVDVVDDLRTAKSGRWKQDTFATRQGESFSSKTTPRST